MVKQYDLISVNLEPTTGNEKGQKRPCLVVSHTEFTKVTKFVWVLPITNRKLKYPTDVALITEYNKVKGIIDCAQIRSLDLNARPFKVIDTLDHLIIHDVKEVLFYLLDS